MHKVLFVGDTSSFVVKALYEGFRSAGLECSECSTAVYAIQRGAIDVDALFLYIEEATLSRRDAFSAIRKLCIDDEKRVFLMGYPSELGQVVADFPEEIIGDIYERPINTKEVVDKFVAKVKSFSNIAKKKHILAVDDNGVLLRTVKSVLEPDYKVTMMNSSINALSFLENSKPDLVLLDYEMPVYSGAEVVERMRSNERQSGIPVIFLTGKHDKESVSKIMPYNVSGYILKTTEPVKIKSIIDKFFDKEAKKIEEEKTKS